MTSSSNEHNPAELHELYPNAFAPESVGRGTFDNNWQPGDPDPNSQRVREVSDPDKPGIQPLPDMVDLGGIRVTRRHAILMGLLPEVSD